MDQRDKIEVTIRSASIAKIVLGCMEVFDVNLVRLNLRQALLEIDSFDKWLMRQAKANIDELDGG